VGTAHGPASGRRPSKHGGSGRERRIFPLRLPKHETAKPRRIAVQSEATAWGITPYTKAPDVPGLCRFFSFASFSFPIANTSPQGDRRSDRRCAGACPVHFYTRVPEANHEDAGR